MGAFAGEAGGVNERRSLKREINHEGHEGHKDRRSARFVSFVLFVVQVLSAPAGRAFLFVR
jgi:hypothetical protein